MTSNQSSQPNTNKKTPTTGTSAPIYTPSPKKEKNPLKVFLPVSIVLGLILLGIIGMLAYNNSSKSRMLETKVAELQEAEELRIELEEQYNQSLADLEDMRGTNEDLNALIDEQKEELEEQKNKIARLIRDKKNLSGAKEEISRLKAQVEEYMAQIESLKSENEELASVNAELENNNSLLQGDLATQMAENASLNEAKVVLVSQNEELSRKVNIASVIKVKDVDVVGFKMKGGKPAEKKSAKAVEQLKVCFTTEANEVTKPGLENFYIRIISPIGETLAVDDLGSGIIIDKKTGDEVPYTQVKEYEYVNDETELCFLWEPNVAFKRGNYEVEVYNKGHMAGKGNFSLK